MSNLARPALGAKVSTRPILSLKSPIPVKEKLEPATEKKEIIPAPEKTTAPPVEKTTKSESAAPAEASIKSDKKSSNVLPREEFNRIFSLAKEKCPELFGHGVKLLKIGIRPDLSTALEIPLELTPKFLKIYCGSQAYLKLQLPGAKRYDLKGIEAGEVTEREAGIAAEMLAKIEERKSLRKSSKKPARKSPKETTKKETVANAVEKDDPTDSSTVLA